MPRQKILLVDDEEHILRSTRMLLDVLGYDCVTLKDASRVIEVAAREHPDLILQDIRMPALNVPALVERLKQTPETSTIPVALFSASPELSEEAWQAHAGGYLTKPFKEEELVKLLNAAIPKRAASRRP